jgi:hypothetical protein
VGLFEHIVSQQERLGVFAWGFLQLAKKIGFEVNGNGFEGNRLGHDSS